MGSYVQWRKGADKGTVRRFTWVCGAELVLVQEVVARITTLVAPERGNLVRCSAGTFPEAELWTAAAEYPASPDQKRLIVVYEAHLLKGWENLISLLSYSRELRHLHMVFVSPEAALTRVTSYSAEGDETTLAYHLAALRDAAQGQLVVCSTPAYEDLIAWVKRLLPVSDTLASYLLTRCGGELSAVRDACTKIRAMEFAELTRGLIDELAVAAPGYDFADSLIWGDKKAAMAAIPGEHELGSLIGLLDARLDMLAELHKAVASGLRGADLHQKMRVPPFVVARYRRCAGGYTEQSVQHRRAVLAVADDAYRQGARVGVAEAIAALW